MFSVRSAASLPFLTAHRHQRFKLKSGCVARENMAKASFNVSTDSVQIVLDNTKYSTYNRTIRRPLKETFMGAITANEIKTNGIAAMERALENAPDAII